MSNPPKSPAILDEEALRLMREDAPGIALPDLVGIFTEEISGRHRRICDALDAGDLKRVEYEVHTLSGTAGTFGALRLQALAVELEHYSHAGDDARVRGLLAALADALDEACAAFRAYAERDAGPPAPSGG